MSYAAEQRGGGRETQLGSDARNSVSFGHGQTQLPRRAIVEVGLVRLESLA